MPRSSSGEPDPYTTVDQPRRADGRRQGPDDVFLIEEILDTEEDIELTSDLTRDHQVRRAVRRQHTAGGRWKCSGHARRGGVEVVVELLADTLHAEGNRHDL